MGEKGNLPEALQDVFVNLAEQGPQFWLSYEQFKQSRAQGQPVPVTGGGEPVTGTVGEATRVETARVTFTPRPAPPAPPAPPAGE